MYTVDKAYILFSSLIEQGEYKVPGTTFQSICKKLHVSPASLEELVWDQLGMGGEEFLASLRAHNA